MEGGYQFDSSSSWGKGLHLPSPPTPLVAFPPFVIQVKSHSELFVFAIVLMFLFPTVLWGGVLVTKYLKKIK